MTGPMSYHYVLHGLTVESDLPLPAPTRRRDAAPDVRLRREPVGADLVADGKRVAASRPRPGEPPAALFHRRSSVVVRFGGVADMRMSAAGSDVAVAPVQGADADLLLDLVLGLPFAYILLRRRRLPLHASAVTFGAGAAVLVAPSLTGKSTLAAACLGAGARLVADDLVAVAPVPTPVVLPGLPAIRLADDSLHAADCPPGPLVRHTRPGWKNWLRTDSRHALDPVGASAILFLQRGPQVREAPGVHAIAPAAAAALLSAQVYGFTMLPPAEKRGALGSVAQFLEAVPCRRLVLSDDLSALADAVTAVATAIGDPNRRG